MDNLNLLTRLLQASGFKTLTSQASFDLFQKLEEALAKDGKPTSVEPIDMVPRTMSKPIFNTDDLLSNEDELVYCLVASWAESVVYPLLRELDKAVPSMREESVEYYEEYELEGISIYTDMRYMEDGEKQMVLCMDGNFNYYANLLGLEDDNLEKVKQVIDDYKHTLALIEDADQFIEIIESRLAQVA